MVFILNALYLPIARKDKNPADSVTKFINIPNNIELCNFGNSQSRDAFGNYETIRDKTCFDFALTAQSLSYNYRIMQQYIDRIEKGATVFICVSYFSFQLDEENEPKFDSKNEKYYYFLEPRYIKQFDIKEFIFIRTFPVLWHTPNTVIENVNDYIRKDHENTEHDTDFERSAEEYFNSRQLLDEAGKLVVVDEEYCALLNMLRICNENELRPIILITPFRKEYTDKYDECFYDQFYGLLDDACTQSGAELWDYSKDARFNTKDEYFLDAYHLSESGSEAFLNVIEESLKSNDGSTISK